MKEKQDKLLLSSNKKGFKALLSILIVYSLCSSILQFLVPSHIAVGIGFLIGMLIAFPFQKQKDSKSFLVWVIHSIIIAVVITIFLALIFTLKGQK